MPKGLKTTAHVHAGKLDLTLVKNGKDVGTTRIECKDAGEYATMILATAQVAFEKSGKPPPIVGNMIDMPVIIAANSARSAHIPGTDVTALIFHFGEAVVGIAIPKESLMSLGQELSAASVPMTGTRQ